MHGVELRERFEDQKIERALKIVFSHILLP